MDNKADYGRIAQLLNIVEKVATVSPQFMAISGAAMAELREVNQAIADEAAAGKLPPTAPLAPIEAAKELPPDGIPTNELPPHESVMIDQVELEHPSSPPQLHRVEEPEFRDPNEPPPDDPAPVMRKV